MPKHNIKDIIRSLLEIDMILEEYRIGNSKSTITVKDLKIYNMRGREYLVFKYKDKVVKIHRKRFIDIDNLDEQNIKSFIDLPTKRIIMPTDPLYNIDGIIEGYVMDFIDGEKSIGDESMQHLIEEMVLLDEDKKILDEKGILLQDLHENNAIYNGKINLIDSGRYINTSIMLPTYMYLVDKVYMQRLSKEELLNLKERIIKTNTSQLNTFLYRFIMQTDLGEIDDFEKLIILKKVGQFFKNMAVEMKTESYIDVLEKECDTSMTVKEFAHKLQKEADINLLR